MEPKNIIMLNHLDVLQSDFAIKVRVVRRWTTPDYKDPNGYYSIELIIQDEENNRMQCSVLKKYGFQYEKLLDENLPVFMDKPSQAQNRAKYRHVNCEQKIVFTPKTKVTLCTSFNGNPFGFCFSNFQDILDKKIGENDLIDVIGVVAKRFDPITSLSADGKLTKRMNILIENLENQSVFITLFGEYCDQMEMFVENNPDATNVVLVLQFAKAKWFQGDPYVSNSFSAARVFIDENIDDIMSFKKRFVSRSPDPITTSQYSISSSLVASALSVHDDFLENTTFSLISDIADVKEPKFLIVLGTIKAVDKDISWFYEACNKCNCKVNDFKCTNGNCNSEQVNSIKRFKIPIFVQDSTGTVSLTMFDRDAKKLLGITAPQLIMDSDEFEGDSLIPKRFKSLLDRKLAFKIHVKDFNLANKVEYYTISKLTEDSSVISVLESKFDVEQPPENEHITQRLNDYTCHTSLPIKDCVSSTGENVTPMSETVKSDGKKTGDNVSPTNLVLMTGVKRNLETVYDVADNSAPCSSKSRLSDKTDEDQVDRNEKLITPKVEK